MPDRDVLVVGAGVAGLTAGLFAARYGLRTTVVDSMGSGGQVLNAERIENFPGFPEGIAGYDLGPLLHDQAERAGASFAFDEVLSVEPAVDGHLVRCVGETYDARAVIVACGSSLRALGVPGEEELRGKGVSNCATCDGPFFQGQTVGVIGGGDSAFDEALILREFASRVVVFNRGEEPRAQAALRARVATADIEVRTSVVVEEIVGVDSVTGVRVRDTKGGQTTSEDMQGVFIYVGLEPRTRFLAPILKLDPGGHVPVDIWMGTEVPGLFAVGDARAQSASQLASAAGDGATAAIAAYRYLAGKGGASQPGSLA